MIPALSLSLCLSASFCLSPARDRERGTKRDREIDLQKERKEAIQTRQTRQVDRVGQDKTG